MAIGVQAKLIKMAQKPVFEQFVFSNQDLDDMLKLAYCCLRRCDVAKCCSLSTQDKSMPEAGSGFDKIRLGGTAHRNNFNMHLTTTI